MSFREAQLLVWGAKPAKANWEHKEIELNEEQKFRIGDDLEVVGICLDAPTIVVKISDGPESYSHIDFYSDKVIDECIEILRGIAATYDWDNHHYEMWRIQSDNNPRA